ncbi:acyltransferase family protein [Acidiferrobacter sp.]
MADGRVRSLDAMRGLAAVSVVLSHYVLVVAHAGRRRYEYASRWLHWLSETPLGLLWAGRAAVLFFFVLSGYVLFIMLERSSLSYWTYLKKRIARLYIPYLAAIGLGIAGAALLYAKPLQGLGPWINKFWSWPPSTGPVVDHVGFVDAFNSDRYDFTIWTLVQEMRISLIFPLLALWIRRLRWQVAWLPFAFVAAGVVLLRGVAQSMGEAWSGVVMGGGLTAYSATIYYMAPFALGALLACHRDAVRRRYCALRPSMRIGISVSAFVLYFYAPRTLAAFGNHRMLVHDWPIMIGAALGLVVVAYEAPIKRFFERGAFQYLGRISYSLYLFHPLVLLAALHVFYGRVALAPLLGLTFVATMLISDLAYRWIERPAAQVARRLGGSYRPDRA